MIWFLFNLEWKQGCFQIYSYSTFQRLFQRAYWLTYISILFLCRTNNSTTTRLMVSFWPTAVLSSKALTGHDLEDTPVKHSMLSVVVKAKSLSWTSNVRHLSIIGSNFFIEWKITAYLIWRKFRACFARRKSIYARFFSSNHTIQNCSMYIFVIWLEKL